MLYKYFWTVTCSKAGVDHWELFDLKTLPPNIQTRRLSEGDLELIILMCLGNDKQIILTVSNDFFPGSTSNLDVV